MSSARASLQVILRTAFFRQTMEFSHDAAFTSDVQRVALTDSGNRRDTFSEFDTDHKVHHITTHDKILESLQLIDAPFLWYSPFLPSVMKRA